MSEIQRKFRSYVKDVLNHFLDNAYLENQELLKVFLSENELNRVDRVQLYREKVRRSVEILRPEATIPDDDSQWRSYRVLSYRYLQGISQLQIQNQLGLSERQIQREIRKGLDALAEILWNFRIQNQNDIISAYPSADEEVQLSEYDLIDEELKAYDSKPTLYNLTYLVEDSLTLCKSLHSSVYVGQFRYDTIDPNIYITVDPVLAKQGIYKIFDLLLRKDESSLIEISAALFGNQFIKLSFGVANGLDPDEQQWQIAQLFFKVQGINPQLSKQPTMITVQFPLARRKRCLVIDDVSSATRLLERMLAGHGIEVLGATNATEAIHMVHEVQPDFILLDILMPEMDGWQVIKELRSIPSLEKTPVIICSVFYEPELSRAVGAAAYVRKPINRLELLKTLDDLGLIDIN